MERETQDPLLAPAPFLLRVLTGAIALAIVLVAVGVLGALTVQRGELETSLAAARLPAAAYWVLVGGLVGAIAMLALGLHFVLELKRIVASVNEGDPFSAPNAARLTRMGWLAVWIQLIGIPLDAAANYLGDVDYPAPPDVGPSGLGFALVLTLFVLARVFRLGVEMREDLEGTV